MARGFRQVELLAIDRQSDRKGTRVNLRIVDRCLVLNLVRSNRRETFDDVPGVADDVADFIQPNFPVRVRGVDDECVAFPVPNGIALPQPQVAGQVLGRVQANDAPCHAFMQNHDVFRRLHNVKRRGHVNAARRACGKTMCRRIVIAALR